MLKVGIDAISFYTSHYYLDLEVLAQVRNIDVSKFHQGLGQYKMAMAAPDEDVVTLAANAAKQVMQYAEPAEIDTILFATESGFDTSKSLGTYIHRLLNFHANCRTVELKQACYSATATLQLGLAYVTRYPQKKVLVIAADVARYGLNTSGESSQGCGAVAMILSAKPQLVAIEPESGLYTDEVMDFWHPNYLDVALVEGKYSSRIYMKALEKTWQQYQEQSQRQYSDIDFSCYHTPVPRLVEKAHKSWLHLNGIDNLSAEEVDAQVAEALKYPRIIGNSYTAALYISLISLLENNQSDLAGKRIGFYSYGSGCVAEYFSGIVQANYRERLTTAQHQRMLQVRQALSYAEYEEFFNYQLPEDGSECQTPKYETGAFRLAGIKDHQRIYTSCDERITGQ